MASPAQLTASRVNGALSHGPVTSEGKAISSQNALKLGVYSEALIIPGEDPADLGQLAAEYRAYYKPVGPEEEAFLEDAIRARWMKLRYFRLEAAVINFRVASNPETESEHAVAAALDQDRKFGNTLQRLYRRREAAHRDWAEAIASLKACQALRRQQESEAPAESDMVAELRREAAAIKAEVTRLGSFRALPQTSSRRPADTPENLALRL